MTDTVTLTRDEANTFLSLASSLSPENLSWDGERSRTAINRERTRLLTAWKRLERTIGRKVDESEVWVAWEHYRKEPA